MNSYRVLVTGCPRSGTHFVERQLRDAGLLVRHERMGVQGTVSSLFCVEDFYYLNDRQSPPRLSACQFDHVVHLVRDPRECIPSMVLNLPARFWRWQEKHTEIMGDLEPAVLRAALFWHVWNGIVEDTFPGAQRIRIEDWPSVWPNLAAKIGAQPRGNVQVAFVSGYGFSAPCAIASTVAHDSHHMIIVGTDEACMAMAANRLAETGGGQVVVRDGKIIGEVQLPIAGLMSNERADGVASKTASVLDGQLKPADARLIPTCNCLCWGGGHSRTSHLGQGAGRCDPF